MNSYEIIFGSDSLFDGAPEDTEAVGGGSPDYDAVVFYKFENDGFSYKYKEEKSDWKLCKLSHPQTRLKAMRRIIRAPVWTKTDKDAGRLPEVGAEVIRVDHEDEGCNVIGEVIATWHCAENNESSQTCLRLKDGTLFLVECYSELRPIETPAEKAERLRDEWCSECTSKYYPRGHKGFPEMIYDALLSGELKAPEVQK